MDFIGLFLAVSFTAFGVKLFGIFSMQLRHHLEGREGRSANTGEIIRSWMDAIEIAIFASISAFLGIAMLLSFVKRNFL